MHPTPIPAPSLWRDFLAWPGGASLIYLVSAACLLGGVGLVLAPAAGLEERIAERFAMTGIVALYTGALLGIACLICHWRRDHGDGVALSVLLSFFLVAAAAPLDVLAMDRPLIVAGLGSVLGLAGVGAVFLWQRRVGSALSPANLVGGSLVLAGAMAAPVLLGLGIKMFGGPNPVGLLGWWQGALAMTTLGLAVIWLGSHAETSRAPRPRSSALLNPLLGRILVLVVGGTAVAQVWLASYAVSLGLGLADLLLPLVLLALALDGLGARHLGVPTVVRLMGWSWGTVLLFFLLRSASVDPMSAPLTQPALAAAVGAAGLGWTAWQQRHWGFAVIALIWAVLASAGAGTWEESRALHLATAGILLWLGLTALAVITRIPALAVLSAVVGSLGSGYRFGLEGHLVILLIGLQMLGLHLLYRGRLPTPVVILGGILVLVGFLGMAERPVLLDWHPALVCGVLALPGMILDRQRLLAFAPLGLPLAGRLVALMLHQPAWAAVIVAFALLGVGLWFSRRRYAAEAAAEDRDLTPLMGLTPGSR